MRYAIFIRHFEALAPAARNTADATPAGAGGNEVHPQQATPAAERTLTPRRRGRRSPRVRVEPNEIAPRGEHGRRAGGVRRRGAAEVASLMSTILTSRRFNGVTPVFRLDEPVRVWTRRLTRVRSEPRT